jgi:TolB-like protein/Flp pilus assembly protein TadD
MKPNNRKDGIQAQLENIKLDLRTYKVLLHFQNRKDPLVIHFDKPARRFYFSLIALVVTEMKNLEKPEFIYIRKHEKTLKLLDNSLAGQNASKTVKGMWDKVRKAWRHRLPDLETAVFFKVLDRNLISPYEKGGKYRYDCSDDECDVWANLFGYDESNPWRFKFAIDSVSLNLNDISVTLGDLRNNSAWQEFMKSLRIQPKAVSREKRAAPRWWKKAAFALVAVSILVVVTSVIRDSYMRPVPPTTETELSDKLSIAILPFVNMSGDPEQEYFSDGITDDLITDLSKISGLFVIARNSTFTYKEKSLKVQQIAKELGVRYVLEGSVRKAGDQVRINAQLIDATSGHHLWAERYDGKMDDIFALQDRITQKIVAALAVKLTEGEQERFAIKDTNSIEAYDAFLQGWEQYLRQTPDDFVKALSYFKKALELDPNYGRAYAALSLTYWNGATFGWARSMGVSSYMVARIRARHYLDIAMKNPTSIAHLAKFWRVYFRRNYQEALAQARRVIALDPNNAEGYMALARILIMTGKPQESIDFVKKAMKLDPRNIVEPLGHLGMAHFSMGQFQETVNLIERALKLNPERTGWGGILAAAYGQLGRDQEARAALDIYRKGWGRLAPNLNLQLVMYFMPYKNAEDADRFADGLLKAGLPGKPSGYYKVSEEHKLSGEEIKSLFFGHTLTLIGISRKQQYWIDRTKDGDATFRLGSKLLGSGKSWVEGDELCNQWQEQKLYEGLKYCMNVFRNPEGTPDEKNDYFLVTDWRIYPSSLED